MKLYKNKDWLYRRYVVQKKKLQEIADECGVSVMTISRQLQTFGISKKV
jgi:DNA-binding MurR/RpiR family transcriptional regulator